MPDPVDPIHVGPGELIDASWGNAVVEDLVWNHTRFVNTVDLVSRFGQLLVQGGPGVITSLADGTINVAFPLPYATAPIVNANIYDNVTNIWVNVYGVSTLGFSGKLWSHTGDTVANYGVGFTYTAIGVAAI
jgi:hypothetical protein